MQKIHPKTLQDLEFTTVLQQLAARCSTELGKLAALEVAPLKDREELMGTLGETSEYLASLTNGNRIPDHGFDQINAELGLLKVDNSTLEVQAFVKIARLCRTVALHQKFLKKFKDYYPLLFMRADALEGNSPIPETVDSVIDRFGEIKDSASPELEKIRRGIGEVRAKINQSFNGAMAHYQAMDYLDEIRESVVDNKRVLAVKAMHRKKVKGSAMGASKTGSIVYMVPEATQAHDRALNNLEFEEREEIQKILNGLTAQIRPHLALLRDYQAYLTRIDICAAKAKYGFEMDALVPGFNEDRVLYLKEAYHPLLHLSNKRKNERTWPQTVKLGPGNRVIVISGPNAGGKSITLKTIGLLQLMVQSGMPIPVHEGSSVCLFDQVLTDIGDNQSIENHLSTYSYRLKNMNRFLRKCTDRTLFLIDEFGTGSDPELGGALAEAFLEEFYQRGAYGAITTHYANLKALADELPHATNANMLFNARTLEPTFQLVLGEAGSSFTFEVAQKNGIPFSLINRAKKKIEHGKVRFDATIAKLQKERSKMARTGSELQEERTKAREEADRLESLNQKIKTKLESYQELYDHNQRMIQLGNKVNMAAERYYLDGKKRPLISELLRLVETENSKRKRTTAQGAREKQRQQREVAQEMEKKIVKVRTDKKQKEKKRAKEERERPRPVFKVGDRVRMQDGKAVGSIDTLEKGKAVVNYGMFTTNVSVDQLELVEAKK